jgi:tetratricopeptide (TPR) repeat protein
MKRNNFTGAYLLLIILLFLVSCKNKNFNKSSDLKTNKNVSNHILNGEEYKKSKEYISAFKVFNEGNYKLAYSNFIELVKKYPNDLELNYHIGFIAGKSNNVPIARKFLLKTIDIDETKWEAYRELASLYKGIYDYKESLSWVKKVFKYEKNDPLSNFIMGYLSNKLEKNDNAYIYYEKAIKATSTYMLAYIHYGEFYFSRKKYEEAERIWKQGLEKKYSSTIASRLATLYTNTKKYDEAISINNELLEKYPKNIEPYFNIGKIYELQGNYKKAIEYYDKALKMNHQYSSPKIALAEIYNKQKKYSKSLAFYQELDSDVIGKTTFYLYKQAEVLKKMGDKQKYSKIIEKLKSNSLKESLDYIKLLER